MIVIGLTGSIGMGKSTAGAMLSHLGVAVHDADACVHELLHYGSPAWRDLTRAFPARLYPKVYRWRWSLSPFGVRQRGVNRGALGKLVFKNDDLRGRLEDVLHPFVRRAQQDFIRTQRQAGRDVVALDVPLLFETGADSFVDYTLVVSAPSHVQHKRVLAREGMNEAKLAAILERQMSDGEKCARADFVVHSGLGRAVMMRGLKDVLAQVNARFVKGEVA